MIAEVIESGMLTMGVRVPEFEAELAGRLREAYPPTEHGTVLPFRRIFAVGHRPE